MSYEPRITPHPAGFPPLGVELETEADHKAITTTASSEAARREMAMLRHLNRGSMANQQRPPQPPELSALPVLPDDHPEQIARLDEEIYSRGIAIDRERLLSLGRARFTELLALDHAAREEQRVVGALDDLTNWPSTFHMFARVGAFRGIAVPQRKTYDQLYGLNPELDEVREVRGFDDLWKFFAVEPRAVRKIYLFRDAFESFVLARSMIDCIGNDGRMRSRFFAGGRGNRVKRFGDWLTVLSGDHFTVTLRHSLQSIIFWSSGQTGDLLDMRELAKDWFGVRAPSDEQIMLATAIFDGFLLGRKDWLLWEHVGRQIRRLPDEWLLKRQREILRERFRTVERFHRELAAFFWKPVTDHREFERDKHRKFFHQTVEKLRDTVSAVVALAIEETSPATITARFRDSILFEGKPQPQLGEKLQQRLAAAFPGATFNIEIK